MERIGALIQRLLEQYERSAGKESLLLTTQILLNELQQIKNDPPSSGQVSVILPSIKRIEIDENLLKQEELRTREATATKNVVSNREEVDSAGKNVVDEEAAAIINTPPKRSLPVRESKKAYQYNLEDIPTFAYQQKTVSDLNDSMAADEESVNDRLKAERTELGNMLQETPVRDLRKAIGINDRFLFINELFRGDENMYERSIKTINSFNALAEAEFWIQRELKTKIGWNEGSDTVQLFDQLVRRRFS